jgi:hypothetical protein
MGIKANPGLGTHAMRFVCIIRPPQERSLSRHTGSDVGAVESTGDSREIAVEKMVGELRYRLESRAKRPLDGCPNLI